MRNQHLSTITDTPILDDTELNALKVKAETLWAKHQQQERDGVSLNESAGA